MSSGATAGSIRLLNLFSSVFLTLVWFLSNFSTDLSIRDRRARSLSRRKFRPLHVVVATGQPTYGLCPK
jgi:hypothetical protein